ncbi:MULTISPECIES: RraA family protein [unclassified Novosphingobium]|uniref:RraA family protein n=1 Tax=unclassified Novosphingobium TaxID=2644732 RepID=UPI000F5DBEF3|nr:MULTISPECIES: RraA family protein [unclassified Novosphingobium]RQW45648.1 RraA family protein [Novosphingobium sp. LASN5T]
MSGADISTRLRAVGTTALSDALDKLAIPGQILGLAPVVRTMGFAGPAFTIQMLPVGITGGSVGDYIDDVAAGEVVLIANDGRMDATVWGDILTFVASTKGVAGTVIDGVCRDSDRCVELAYPVFARGSTMRTGKDRVTAHAFNVAVEVASVRIEPGDWLVGDADGVVAIPKDRVAEVAEIAERIEAVEEQIRDLVRGGMRLDEARRALNYHLLQTPNS